MQHINIETKQKQENAEMYIILIKGGICCAPRQWGQIRFVRLLHPNNVYNQWLRENQRYNACQCNFGRFTTVFRFYFINNIEKEKTQSRIYYTCVPRSSFPKLTTDSSLIHCHLFIRDYNLPIPNLSFANNSSRAPHILRGRYILNSDPEHFYLRKKNVRFK